MAHQGAIAARGRQLVVAGLLRPALHPGGQHRELGVLQAVFQGQDAVGALTLTRAQAVRRGQHLDPALAGALVQRTLVAIAQGQQLYAGVFAQHYLALPQQLPIYQDAHRQRDVEEVIGKTIRQTLGLLQHIEGLGGAIPGRPDRLTQHGQCQQEREIGHNSSHSWHQRKQKGSPDTGSPSSSRTLRYGALGAADSNTMFTTP